VLQPKPRPFVSRSRFYSEIGGCKHWPETDPIEEGRSWKTKILGDSSHISLRTSLLLRRHGVVCGVGTVVGIPRRSHRRHSLSACKLGDTRYRTRRPGCHATSTAVDGDIRAGMAISATAHLATKKPHSPQPAQTQDRVPCEWIITSRAKLVSIIFLTLVSPACMPSSYAT